MPADLCALKTPVIFIDMRERPSLLDELDRSYMIQKAKDWHDNFRNEMVRHAGCTTNEHLTADSLSC